MQRFLLQLRHARRLQQLRLRRPRALRLRMWLRMRLWVRLRMRLQQRARMRMQKERRLPVRRRGRGQSVGSGRHALYLHLLRLPLSGGAGREAVRIPTRRGSRALSRPFSCRHARSLL